MVDQFLTIILGVISWGSVSDWVMVVVTIAAALLLLWTLKSQKEVQRTQTELFKIESTRFRESIKPKLKFTASTDKFIPSDEIKKILTIEVINETDQAALTISKLVSDKEYSSQIFIPTGFSDIKDFLIKGDAPLLFHFIIDKKNPTSGLVIFTIKYQDIAGTKYSQRVFCICDEHGIEINPSLPKVISVNEDRNPKLNKENQKV